MLRRGYIERQIEALGLAIAQIVGLKDRGSLAEAAHELREAGKRFTGMDTFALTRLSDESLLSFLSSSDEPEPGRYILAATILREHAELLELQGQPDVARGARRKALTLLIEAMMLGDWFRTKERLSTVQSLLEQLQDDVLPPSMNRRLFRYFEAIGSYGRAEDALYELRNDDEPDWSAEAAAFYHRLVGLADKDLEHGGLPRDEILQGMKDASAKVARR